MYAAVAQPEVIWQYHMGQMGCMCQVRIGWRGSPMKGGLKKERVEFKIVSKAANKDGKVGMEARFKSNKTLI